MWCVCPRFRRFPSGLKSHKEATLRHKRQMNISSFAPCAISAPGVGTRGQVVTHAGAREKDTAKLTSALEKRPYAHPQSRAHPCFAQRSPPLRHRVRRFEWCLPPHVLSLSPTSPSEPVGAGSPYARGSQDWTAKGASRQLSTPSRIRHMHIHTSTFVGACCIYMYSL